MAPDRPEIDEVDVAQLLAAADLLSGVPLPADGPPVAEHVRIVQLVEAALSPELQRVIAQLAQRTPPAP